jgi:dsRNA-specific ribonuclease
VIINSSVYSKGRGSSKQAAAQQAAQNALKLLELEPLK